MHVPFINLYTNSRLKCAPRELDEMKILQNATAGREGRGRQGARTWYLVYHFKNRTAECDNVRSRDNGVDNK